MKKYKLIKIYPGSPELGAELFFWEGRWRVSKNCGNYSMIGHPVDYPDNWQEVIEKDYEILSFKNKDFNYTLEGNEINGFSNEFKTVNLKSCFKYHEIHSVKRLSDGEVFTVGDNTKYGCIDTFYIKQNYLMVTTVLESIGRHLKDIILLKKPLFTTEDGVDIFKDDDFHIIIKPYDSENWNVCKQVANGYYLKNKPIELCFSTKEAAEEYILMNKPKFSINDIGKLLWLDKPERKRIDCNYLIKLLRKSKL